MFLFKIIFLKANSLASKGQYFGGEKGAAGGESLFIANHAY